MKILIAAPVSYDRLTQFISHYSVGLARAAKLLNHEVRIIETTENMYNPIVWKSIETEYRALRKIFKPIIDLPHDLLLINQLLREIQEFKPDIMLLHLIDTFYFPYFTDKIKRLGTCILFWLGAHPSKVSSGIHRLARKSDKTLIYDSSYIPYFNEKLNINNIELLPLGCDLPFFEKSKNDNLNSRKKYDICFIGSIDKYREKYLNLLTNFNLGIWTWNNYDSHTPLINFFKGEVHGQEMVEVIRSSKNALNIHKEYEKKWWEL